MNKKVLKVAGLAVLGLGIFTLGSFSDEIYIKATGDWQTTAINKASSEISSAGYYKKEEIKANADTDIDAQMETKVSPEIDAAQAELERMLQEYYQMKINGLENSPEYLALQQQIEKIKLDIFNRYKVEIDALFTPTQP